MQRLAEAINTLANQLDSLKQVSKSDQLRQAIGEFLEMMEEVVDFIQNWLGSWSGTYSFA